MIRHALIEIHDNGCVDLTLPDGEQVRFAGVELADEFLRWADGNIGAKEGSDDESGRGFQVQDR